MPDHIIVPREAVRGLRGFMPDLPDRTIPELRRLLGIKDVIKLSFNESPYGSSPKAVAAMQQAALDVHFYHDPEGKEVRESLAAYHGVSAEGIFLANGADEVITLLAQTFLSTGDEAIVADPSFGQYAFAAKLMGAIPVAVPVRADMALDLTAMAEAISARTKLIFICNPNNPTSVISGGEELGVFMAKVPPSVVVVLDEAYAEYVDDSRYVSGITLLDRFPNIITVRTFSKVYGLAALRLGYGMASPKLSALVERVRAPFNVNALAQAAAIAALQDIAFRDTVVERNKAERTRVAAALANFGFTVYPSQTNFIFADAGRDSEKLCQALAEQGIIIRPGSNWGLPSHTRISLGTGQQNDKLIEALTGLLLQL